MPVFVCRPHGGLLRYVATVFEYRVRSVGYNFRVRNSWPLQILDLADQLSCHRLAVAVKHPGLIEEEQRILDS